MLLPKGSFKAKLIRSNFSNVIRVVGIMNFSGYSRIHGNCTDITLVFKTGICILGEGFPKSYSFEDITRNFKDFIFDYDFYSFSDDEIIETKLKNPGCTFKDFESLSDDENSIFETELKKLDLDKIENMKQNITKDIKNMLNDMELNHILAENKEVNADQF